MFGKQTFFARKGDFAKPGSDDVCVRVSVEYSITTGFALDSCTITITKSAVTGAGFKSRLGTGDELGVSKWLQCNA